MNRKFIRNQELAENIVIIDGFSCSGKSMIAPILSSLERGELWILNHIYEYLAVMANFKQMDSQAASTMLQIYADLDLYNLMIGRNTNFRETDESGVVKNFLSERYSTRLKAKDGDIITKKIKDTKPILYLMTHYIFSFSKPIFDAFQERLKAFIIMKRHPIWLIENWYEAKWDERIGKDPREVQLSYAINGKEYPWTAYGWEEKYDNYSPLERAIATISTYFSREEKLYQELPQSQRSKIIFISFEDFVQKPEPYLKDLMNRLQTKETSITAKIIKEARVPRVFEDDYLNKKKNEFFKFMNTQNVSKELIKDVELLCEGYEMKLISKNNSVC